MAHTSISGGIVFATFAAGPIFVSADLTAWLYLQSPAPITLAPSQALLLVVLIIPVFAIGCILSIVPNLIGTSLLARLADTWPDARLPEFWTGVGAIAGAGLAAATGSFQSQSAPAAFGLIVTSAACAWICRRPIVWDERNP